jgi:peptidoglycan/LPS O-acetylase OafA/YrhL
LDGIRGIGILFVLARHYIKRAEYLTGNDFLLSLTSLTAWNWVWVDTFFALSGFLIMGILLRSKGKPGYFKLFYMRRSLRIFPIYYAIVIPLLIFLPYLDPDQGARTQAMWPVFMIYQQNWLYTVEPEYSLFLGITWSLAVEEQFYLMWPAIVHFLDRKKLTILLIGVMIYSFVARVLLVNFAQGILPVNTILYYGSVTRFEGMAAGSLLALMFESRNVWYERFKQYAWHVLIAMLLCFALVTWGRDAFPASDNNLVSIWGYTFVAIGACALIMLLQTQPDGSWLRTLFNQPVFGFLGKHSYAIYMIHYPIGLLLWEYAISTGRQNGWMWLSYMIVASALSIFGGWLIWHLLEKHMLNLKRYFEYQK